MAPNLMMATLNLHPPAVTSQKAVDQSIDHELPLLSIDSLSISPSNHTEDPSCYYFSVLADDYASRRISEYDTALNTGRTSEAQLFISIASLSQTWTQIMRRRSTVRSLSEKYLFSYRTYDDVLRPPFQLWSQQQVLSSALIMTVAS